MTDWTVKALEWWAGKLLLQSYKLRTERGDTEDIHEARHIRAAFEAGTSDKCRPGYCTLDSRSP